MRDRMAGPETGLFFLHKAQQRALAYEGGGLLDGPSLFSVENGRCIRLPLPGTSDTQRLIYATIRSTAQRRFTDNDCTHCISCPLMAERHDLHAYLSEAQPRTQRIWHWHWSRGTVRTTYRHFNALHASLPGNHGYAAVRQGWGTTAHRWSAAELVVRGSVFGVTYQAWTRNTRTGLSQQQWPFSSVGYHAGEPLKPLSIIYTVVNAEGRLVL